MHTYLETNAATLDFTIPKTPDNFEIAKQINDACKYEVEIDGTIQRFYTYRHTENFATIQVSCQNLALELLAEQNYPWLNDKQLQISDYIEQLISKKGAKATIRTNQIADRRRTITFEEPATKIARLQTLASSFNALIRTSNDGNILVIDIFDKNSEEALTYREDIILTSDDIKDFTIESDKSEMYNAITMTGKRVEKDQESIITIGNLEKEWKNSDGIVEFYTRKGSVAMYAPLAKEAYTKNEGNTDDWTIYEGESEYQNENDLLAYMHSFLQDHAYPQRSMTLDVIRTEKVDSLRIGDRIRVDVSDKIPDGIFSMTISEVDKSLNDYQTVTLTVKRVINRRSALPASLIDKIKLIQEASAKYDLELTTDKALVFENDSDRAMVEANLFKLEKPVEATFKWFFDSKLKKSGQTIVIRNDDIETSHLLTCEAYVDNLKVASKQLSITKIQSGKPIYTHQAFANSADGMTDFSVKDMGKRRYFGTMTSYNQEPSLEPTDYKWFDTLPPATSEKIDSKADEALTIEQINALFERADLAKAELEAKASLDTVNKWIDELEKEIEARKNGQKASEQALIDTSNRIIGLQQTMGETKIQTDFVKTYMSQSEDGMVIGRKDGSASVKISNDRISFFSAGKETAFISQGVLQIENGIFTKKLQIGRYRIEQYNLNPDMNVIRYVGEVM